MQLDTKDTAVLNLIQSDFPISEDPYAELGAELSMSAEEVLERVKGLVASNVVRKVGAFFDAKTLGHKSTLCAVDVPEVSNGRLDEVAAIISSYPGVTHNYLREGSPNLWFTLISPSADELSDTIDEISERTGAGPIHNLPVTKRFKLRLDLKVK